jgi:hypothetical protein
MLSATFALPISEPLLDMSALADEELLGNTVTRSAWSNHSSWSREGISRFMVTRHLLGHEFKLDVKPSSHTVWRGIRYASIFLLQAVDSS